MTDLIAQRRAAERAIVLQAHREDRDDHEIASPTAGPQATLAAGSDA
jgi:hypothetical protein